MGRRITDFGPAVQRRIREALADQVREAKPPAGPVKEARPQARPPLVAPERVGMNRTERRYADFLDRLKQNDEVLCWLFEPFGLRLGEKCFYHPDFLVWYADGRLEVHEVKGFWRDDARVKIKAAAAKYRMFCFFGVKARGGDFEFESF